MHDLQATRNRVVACWGPFGAALAFQDKVNCLMICASHLSRGDSRQGGTRESGAATLTSSVDTLLRMGLAFAAAP
jgi:hypothetical protein